MKAEYLNSRPIFKSCSNCVYCVKNEIDERFDHCGLSGNYCIIERRYNNKCDEGFSGWAPIPPKPPCRSLRRWLYDTFFAP